MEFNYKWLEQPRWSWVQPGSNAYTFQCVLCNKQLALFGIMSLVRHANGKRHLAFENQVSNHNIMLSPGVDSIKNLEPLEEQKLNINVNGEQSPISKGERRTDKRSHSIKTTHEIMIPVNATAESEWPSSTLEMDSERIHSQNSHLNNLQNTEADIFMKTEPCSVTCTNVTDWKQIWNFEIDEKIQRLSKEIEILQHCAIEKAELCEATGNIRYVVESNTFRRIAEEKTQELEKVKELLTPIVI